MCRILYSSPFSIWARWAKCASDPIGQGDRREQVKYFKWPASTQLPTRCPGKFIFTFKFNPSSIPFRAIHTYSRLHFQCTWCTSSSFSSPLSLTRMSCLTLKSISNGTEKCKLTKCPSHNWSLKNSKGCSCSHCLQYVWRERERERGGILGFEKLKSFNWFRPCYYQRKENSSHKCEKCQKSTAKQQRHNWPLWTVNCFTWYALSRGSSL